MKCLCGINSKQVLKDKKILYKISYTCILDGIYLHFPYQVLHTKYKLSMEKYIVFNIVSLIKNLFYEKKL